MIDRRLVIIESPFAGDVVRNVRYARACVRDSLQRGEAPIASHLLYTQDGILRDDVPEERTQGIEVGLAWGRVAAANIFYIDLGMSSGMQYGHDRAIAEGRIVEFRRLGGDWASPENMVNDCGSPGPICAIEEPHPYCERHQQLNGRVL